VVRHRDQRPTSMDTDFCFTVVEQLVDATVPATVENVTRFVPEAKRHLVTQALGVLLADGRLEARPFFAPGQSSTQPMYVHYVTATLKVRSGQGQRS
jgi:hypothetical protein